MFLFQGVKTKPIIDFLEILGSKETPGPLLEKLQRILQEYKILDPKDPEAVKKFEKKLAPINKDIMDLYKLANNSYGSDPGRIEALAFCHVGAAFLKSAYEKISVHTYDSLFDSIGENIDKNYINLPGFKEAQTDYRALYLAETIPGVKEDVKKTISSADFSQMKSDTYGMFDHLNFNVVSGDVTNGMNLEDYKDELLAFYENAKGSGNAEELAFCYRSFEWLNTTALGGNFSSKQLAEINSMEVSKSSEFQDKSGYYSKYFEVLARSVVGGTENGTNVLWYHIGEEATNELARYRYNISKDGAMGKYGVFVFYTSENANIFVDQVLKKFGNVSFEYEIKNEGGKWKVYFKGKEDAGKTADPLRDSPGEFFAYRDMEMDNYDSNQLRIRLNEVITNIIKGKEIQTGEKVALDFANNKEKEEVLEATNQEMASIWAHTPMFHAHHYKPIKNPEKTTEWIMLYLQGRLGEASPKGQDEREILNSIESLGISFKKMLSDLAVRDGFDADKASLVEFLMTDAGRKFWNGLVQSVKDGTFVNVTGATSEYLGSPSDAIKQFDLVAVGRSKLTMLFLNAMARYTNSELARDPNFNGETQLREIDENSVSLVPTVVLLVDPGNTGELIEKALEYYKRGGNRSEEDIAFVQKKLEEFYSPQTIAQNQHNFIAAIEDLSSTSSEAERIWNRWNKKGFVKQDSETGLYSFNRKYIGSINTEISFNNRLKQPDQTFEQALYVCSTKYPLGGEFIDARYSAYNLLRNVSLTLNIDKTEVKDNQVKVTVWAQKQFENKSGKLEDKPFAGRIDQYLFTEDGTRIDGSETNRYEKDGKTFIEFTYAVAPGQKCTFVGNAFDEINSGMVKKGIQNEEKVEYWGNPKVHGGEVTILPWTDEEMAIRVRAFGEVFSMKDKKQDKMIDRVPIDFLTIIAGRDASDNVTCFLPPGMKKDVSVSKNAAIHSFTLNGSKIDMVVDRPLVFGNSQLSSEQLNDMLKNGIVAFIPEGSKYYYSLDGVILTDAEAKSLAKDKLDNGTEVLKASDLKSRKGGVMFLSKEPNKLILNDPDTKMNEEFVSRMPREISMKNYIVISDKSVKVGKETYDKDDFLQMAQENKIAVVVGDKILGVDGTVYGSFSELKTLLNNPADDWTDVLKESPRAKQDIINGYKGLPRYFPRSDLHKYSMLVKYYNRDDQNKYGVEEFEYAIPVYVPKDVDNIKALSFSLQAPGKFDYGAMLKK